MRNRRPKQHSISMALMKRLMEDLYMPPEQASELKKIQKQVDNIEAINAGQIPDNFDFDKFFKEL